jgi:putative transposase
MAGRKRHSAEDIVRKLGRADKLAAEGKTGEATARRITESVEKTSDWGHQPSTVNAATSGSDHGWTSRWSHPRRSANTVSLPKQGVRAVDDGSQRG